MQHFWLLQPKRPLLRERLEVSAKTADGLKMTSIAGIEIPANFVLFPVSRNSINTLHPLWRLRQTDFTLVLLNSLLIST